ncbi:MAG: MaoC family dehydratase [Candidatus Diapherotrites archaeon]
MVPESKYKIRPFADLQIGETASLKRTVEEKDLEEFAKVSQDTNPIHLDDEIARKSIFKGKVAQGMLLGAMISALLGTKLPGNGYIYRSQDLKFLRPARIGDTLTVKAKISNKNYEKKHVDVETTITNHKGELLVKGRASAKAPF